MRKIFIVFCLLYASVGFSQLVLVDDAPMCGHHDRTTWQVLWDSLTTHGASINFTTTTGRFPSLDSYDLLILMHHGECGFTGFSYDRRTQIIDFVCNGGNLIIMPIAYDRIDPHNELLHDSRWVTGITYGGSGGFVLTTNISPYPPLTNDLDYLVFEMTSKIFTTSPAYPFVWDESSHRVIAAVSYPVRVDGEDCDCHLGGRIIALPDCHTFETGVVGYTEPMDFKFMTNALNALARIEGYDIDDCFTPPGVPRLDSLPCAAPGETAHLYGYNISPDIDLFFDDISIPFTWYDSTHISFTVPLSAIQGIYTVKISIDGRIYRTNIRVFCTWVDLDVFTGGCYMPGDTVDFGGENFSVSGGLVSLILPDESDTIDLTDYEFITSTNGWFIIPEDVDTGYEDYYRVMITNTDIGNSDVALIRLPCPCPAQAGLYGEYVCPLIPADTWNPRLTVHCPPDGEIGDTTSITWTLSDSFIPPMTLGPIYPIEIAWSSNGGSEWEFLGYSDNLSSLFEWQYPATNSHNCHIRICVTDSFGNRACDECGTFSITGDIERPTGYAYGDTCTSDSVFFVFHDDGGMDWSSVCIQDIEGILCYPDSMRVVGDSMIVFYPREPSVEGRYYIRLFSAEDLSGNRVHEMDVDEYFLRHTRTDCCFNLDAWLECPDGGGFIGTSCLEQNVTFGLYSEYTDEPLDTTRVFIRRITGGSETLLTPADMNFIFDGDTTWIEIPGSYSEGDSVFILLDSLFNREGCITAP